MEPIKNVQNGDLIVYTNRSSFWKKKRWALHLTNVVLLRYEMGTNEQH